VRIFIYSSGSVLAQKLLFSKSSAGDLSPWISGYFDTKVGSKREADSYKAIAQQISIAPERCLFISDIVSECEAANRAGFQVRQAVRPGNNPQKSSFATISSFRDIELGFS
jgi:enolase-phosphatase E1